MGVITTLWWGAKNALKLEKEKFDKSIELENQKFLKDRRSISTALMSELGNLSDSMTRISDAFRNQQHPVIKYDLDALRSAGPVFTALLPKVSTLRPAAISDVCAAYEQIRRLPDLCVSAGVARKINENDPYFELKTQAAALMFEEVNNHLRKARINLSADVERAVPAGVAEIRR